MSLGQVYEHDGITVSKKVSGDMGTMALQKLCCQARQKMGGNVLKKLVTQRLPPFQPRHHKSSTNSSECHPVHDVTIFIPRILRYHQSLTHHAVTDIRLLLRTEETIHDDLPDYDRGTLDGNASAHLAWFIVSITPVLFGVHKAKR